MSLNMNNYEEWMVAYIDGELSVEEVKEFNQFLEKNPALKAELTSYESLQFDAEEEVVFENIEVLYKRESGLVLLKKAWPLAAAIVLLLCILPFLKDDNPEETKTIVRSNDKKVDTPLVIQKSTAAKVEDEVAAASAVQPHTIHTPPVISQRAHKTVRTEKRAVAHKKTNAVRKGERYFELPKAPVPVKDFEQAPEQNQFAKEVKEPKEVQSPAVIKNEQKALVKNNNENTEPFKEPTMKDVEPKKERSSFVVISKETTPAIHDKLNEVVTRVEDNIETIKKIKKSPITVCIGKRKLFTLNN